MNQKISKLLGILFVVSGSLDKVRHEGNISYSYTHGDSESSIISYPQRAQHLETSYIECTE